MAAVTRRRFLAATGLGGLAMATGWPLGAARAWEEKADATGMRFGLVTYLWGQSYELPALLDICEHSGVLGLELRTQHAHGVEPELSPAERREVAQRFADSPVELVGYGSNAQFHEADPAKVRENIELTKAYVRLMHDCGGSGVKVKPNAFPPGVPREKTIEQIGRALNEVARYGADYGQEIRVEVHGRGTSELPVIDAIFEVADHPNVGVCWNSNDVDLAGKGLEYNFNLVKDRLADTVHVREFNVGDYPYPQLMDLLSQAGYQGWILLEARTKVDDTVQALKEQRELFEKMVG